jgi:putative RecB family exonuclease
MPNTYSPSRIGAFDKCRLSYKYEYIDGLESDIETIERFFGSRLHEALEEFYILVKGGHIESLEWLLGKYNDLWKKNYVDNIKIVKKELKEEDYFNKGKQCLIDYYNKYKPFNQTKIVDTEQLINFDIEFNGIKYPFRGKLDRLDWNNRENAFEIHDYKTGGRLITQREADNDWQLGLYHVALNNKWPDVVKIKLVWHFLSMDKEIFSFRTKIQIDKLQEMAVKKINEIESCNNFSPNKSVLCDWCDFQNICPLWKHPKEMEVVPINEYKKDPGVKLVVAYKKLEEGKNELKEEIQKIEEEQEKIKEAAIEFAESKEISIIDGPEVRLKVDIKDELRAPTRSENQEMWEGLREFLRIEGKFEEVSTVNNNMVNYKIRNKIWDSDFIEKVGKYLTRQIIKTVRLIKK